MFDPFRNIFGGYSQSDGTMDFYGRVGLLAGSDKTYLDLGAGRGGWYEDEEIEPRKRVQLMKGKFKETIAVDLDETVLENKTVDRCLLMTDGKIPLDDRSVDVVVCDCVFEHVDDVAGFSKEIDRVLRDGGWLCARTPHKFGYVSTFARLLHNSMHKQLLRYIQPTRKVEEDVFPTRYRLNTLSKVRSAFSGYDDKSFIFRGDPSYYFGSKGVFLMLTAVHRVLPAFFVGALFVFLRKPPSPGKTV